jgi:hypothetical protein
MTHEAARVARRSRSGAEDLRAPAYLNARKASHKLQCIVSSESTMQLSHALADAEVTIRASCYCRQQALT